MAKEKLSFIKTTLTNKHRRL